MAPNRPTEHSAEYLAVLQSPRWKAFSASLRRDDPCAVCRNRYVASAMQVHHLHYWTLGGIAA